MAQGFLAQAPAGAIAVRLVRTYTSPKFSLGTEIVEELLDLEPGVDPGTWDGVRLEWLSPVGITSKLQVQPDDHLLSLVHNAARRFGCVAMAGHESEALGHAVVDDETWYGKNPIPAETVTVSSGPNGDTRVEVAIEAKAWPILWLFAPLVFLSFAWVVFLFIGGLKEMWRKFWRMTVTGSSQHLTVTLDENQITVHHQDSSEPDRTETTSSDGLMAFSSSMSGTQLLAIFPDRTMQLPSLAERQNDNEKKAQIDLVNQLNLVLGSY